MDWDRRVIRACAAVLICACLLRLSAGGIFRSLLRTLENPGVASFLVYLQTGRVVRLAGDSPAPTSPETQPPPVEESIPAVSPAPVFTAEDLSLVEMNYGCSYRPDLEALLTQPLDYDLSGSGPSVLILHTHTTESYTPAPGDSYEQTSSYRTLDQRCNMLRVGDLVAQTLEQAGIGVIHDRQFHDYPSYTGSYDHAAQSICEYLEEYPSIRLVLDLHRDAADTDYGQMVTQACVNGQQSAQLMIIVGTDAGGLIHPDWQENLSLALKLQVLLEKENPGICRELKLTYQRYNQNLSPGALLIEVGAAGNTMDEALVAAQALSESIMELFPR